MSDKPLLHEKLAKAPSNKGHIKTGMQNLFKELIGTLKNDERLIIEGGLVKNQARHATSRNSGTPVAVIRSPTQRIGDAPAALRPPQTEHKAAQSWLPQMALRLFGIKF